MVCKKGEIFLIPKGSAMVLGVEGHAGHIIP